MKRSRCTSRPKRVPFIFALCIGLVAMGLFMPPSYAEDEKSWWKSIGDKTKEVFDDVVEEVTDTIDGDDGEKSGTTVAAPVYSTSEVRESQQLLNKLGYDAGVVDGAYGAKTGKAIRAYESDHGLPMTGKPTADRVAHMRRSQNAAQVATSSQATSVPATGMTAPAPTGGTTASAPAGSMTAPAPTGGMIAPAPAGSMTAPAVVGAQSMPAKGNTAAQSAASPNSGAAGDASAAGLRLVNGLPLLQSKGGLGSMEREGIITRDQAAAAVRYLDHIRVGINPHLARAPDAGDAKDSKWSHLDRRALCVANALLTDSEKAQVLGSGAAASLWRGTGRDEFEAQRARETYNSQLLPKLLARAPRLPMEFVSVDVESVGSYDNAQQAFPFHGAVELGLPRSVCFHDSGDYLPIANPIAASWPLAADKAEAVARQIPVEGKLSGVPGMEKRKVFSAIVYTLWAAPESPFNQQGPPRTPMRLQVDSVALYEDPDLERLLYTYALDHPASAVMLAGVPERVPTRETVLFDAEAATLLLLRERGDVLSTDAWNILARQHAAKDALYYDKEEMNLVEGFYHKRELDSFNPAYLPFFPQGVGLKHSEQLSSQQLTTFKAWSLKRATALGDKFVVAGKFERVRAKTGGYSDEKRLRIGYSGSEKRYLVKQLTSEGIAGTRIARPKFTGVSSGTDMHQDAMAGPDGRRTTLFVFEHPLPEYVPAVTVDALAPHYQGVRGSYPALMDVAVTGLRLMTVEPDSRSYVTREKEALVFDLQPYGVSLIATDGFQVAYRESYDMAAMQAKADSAQQAETDERAREVAAAEEAAASKLRFRETLDNADILGIRLGMSASQAEAALRKKVDVGWITRVGNNIPYTVFSPTQPYGQFKSYLSSDGTQQLTLFFHTANGGKLVAVTRSIALAQGTKPEQVLTQVQKKYGEASLKNGNNYTWTLDVESAHSRESHARDCRTQIGSISDIYLIQDDGSEFSRDDRKLIQIGISSILVYGGRKKAGLNGQEIVWDSTVWKDCDATTHVKLLKQGESLSLYMAILDLGAYADVYAAWIQDSKNSQVVELPEL